ncbi:MAG TPA: acyltransferase [Novosphingobium sp.]|nr:acyltransferase [Novosphingobium sp.]
MNRAEFAALTGLRGVAAWFVVLFHVRVLLGGTVPVWLMPLLGKGYLAVDLFFILSGFVLWHSWAGRLDGAGLAGARHFWWRRVARIWPLHALVLAGFVALALALRATGRDAGAWPFAHLPWHVLLVQAWGFTPALEWNDPAWSISCEMAASLLFPAVVALAMAVEARWRLADAGLIALAAGLVAGLWGFFALHGATTLGGDVSHTGLVRCLLEFALGNALRVMFGRWGSRRWLAGAAWALVGAALLVQWAGLAETVAMPVAFAALILALATGRGWAGRALGARALHALGEVSYATYLAHYGLYTVFKLAFVHPAPGHAAAMGLGQLAGFLALVLAASFALYHGVEKPAQRWFNALPGRMTAPRRPLPAQ